MPLANAAHRQPNNSGCPDSTMAARTEAHATRKVKTILNAANTLTPCFDSLVNVRNRN